MLSVQFERSVIQITRLTREIVMRETLEQCKWVTDGFT
jgi:hypothetical protein